VFPTRLDVYQKVDCPHGLQAPSHANPPQQAHDVECAARPVLTNALLVFSEFPPVTSEADLMLQVYNGVRFCSYRKMVPTTKHKHNGKIAHSAAVNSNSKAGHCGPVSSELCLVRGSLPRVCALSDELYFKVNKAGSCRKRRQTGNLVCLSFCNVTRSPVQR
jgi:hypothetical protein